MIGSLSKILEFWIWFQKHECAIILAIGQRDVQWLRTNITPQLRTIQMADARVRLDWEIGPGKCKEWQFAISPVVRENFELAEYAVAQAPELDRWEWYAAKPAKRGRALQLELTAADGTRITIDASTWQFALKRIESSNKLGILMVAPDLPPIGPLLRKQIAYLILDNVLGEKRVIDVFGEAWLVNATSTPKGMHLFPMPKIKEHLEQENGS